MPAAERRLTAPPSPGADVARILELLHGLGLSWTQVRDRSEDTATDIANACRIFATPEQQVRDLPLSVRNVLRAEVEARFQEKEARKAKRAANKARKEAIAS